ncbi:methyltransferase [Paraglaciecola sp. 25GB23A]|uniref:tRNA1(Val) (adenine(37)-N6)-methyltransferase n=1 Tax=Paraglaciecola sp. 25GB23A TaxID=3156068 RepID=UPI0032AF1B06
MTRVKAGFQFKQFFIEHSLCAMKVGTDSILLGSWIKPEQAQNVLDIGTGSGLLAVMLAQKTTYSCQLYGIDIDPDAVKQAKINGLLSPWPNKLNFAHVALQDLRHQRHWPQQFDLIVSNPPYFAQNPSSNQQNIQQHDQARINARQVSCLAHSELLKYVNVHLSDRGTFICILPADICAKFIQQAQQQQLFVVHQLQVKSIVGGKITRQILKFSRYSSETLYDNLLIYSQAKQYSSQYIELCRDYYLRF